VVAFGTREDVPLPGLTFSSGSTRYLAFFRQRTGEWKWVPTTGGTTTTKTLGGPGSVPVPALYDNDALTDLAVYNPGTADFKLMRSQTNWVGTITRSFGSVYVPQVGGTAGQRSGAIPLSGVTRQEWICVGSGSTQFCHNEPRHAFTLFYPNEGIWTTMWDPANSSGIDKCIFGNGATDIPLPGIRLNLDLYTDMVVYRGESGSTPGYFSFKNSTPSMPNVCNGSSQTLTFAGLNQPRLRVFAVSDMTGDGKPEIMIVHPEIMRIEWLTSESAFSTSVFRDIGNHRAIVL